MSLYSRICKSLSDLLDLGPQETTPLLSVPSRPLEPLYAVAPAVETVLVVPPKPEPLSCVALGIIRSMKETPGQWHTVRERMKKRSGGMGHQNWCDLFHFRHTVTKVSVKATRYYYSSGDTTSYWVFTPIVSLNLTSDECEAIGEAAETHLDTPKREAATRKRERAEAKTRRVVTSHFERLGCPADSTLDNAEHHSQS